jgi:hypothetical protein
MPLTKVVEDTILYRKRVINGILLLDYIIILKILMSDPLVYSQTTVHVYIGYMAPPTQPDQTFDILLIGFDVKIRSKNLIRVRSVYCSNPDQKPPYSPIKNFDRGIWRFLIRV